MDKKKLDWKKLGEHFKEMVSNATEETRDAIVVDVENGYIDVFPAETNKSNGLFHTEEVVDFCRYWKLTHWVGIWDGKVYAHIY